MLEQQFLSILKLLQDWHSDSVKAQNFDGPQIHQTKAGTTVLTAQDYPRTRYWQDRWRLAKGAAQAFEVLIEMRQEYDDLGRSPSKKHLYFPNTLEQKTAIANEDGDAKDVARTFGVGVSTVYKYRKLYR